ncbi:MAG: hemolysin family protein [Bacillales bacterium]|nr:hemolysin family protein [Bacillales bacterium]
MRTTDYFLLVVIAILVVLSGIFSMSDMVYGVVNQLRLKKDVEKGSKRAKIALNFASNYDTTISTILFSNNLVNIAASSLSAIVGLRIFSSLDNDLAGTITSLILLVIILIFGEICPKVIGRVFSYPLSKLLAYPILVLKYVFFPFVYVTSAFGRLLTKPITKIKESDDDEPISDEELQEMVDQIEEDEVIDEDQAELLRSAIEFKETEAHEIMTPRIDMFAFNIDDNIEELTHDDDIFAHSRIPVYKDTIDNIIGILPTKRVLKNMLAKQKINVLEMILPVEFVPGSMPISNILSKMKNSQTHIVIVKDEFGGTDGLLTMEDILEELVGEIWDETDTPIEFYKKLNENTYVVDGSMNIDDLFELLEKELLEDNEFTSVGGWVIDKLERFAKIGDSFDYENLTVTVLDATEFTVEKVKIVKHKIEEE